MPMAWLCCLIFKEKFSEIQKRLTLAGNIVISVGFFDHSDVTDEWDDHVKQMLDQMHLQKIDMADGIYVIDVGSYVGESTRREISYAQSKGKRVTFYSSDKDRLMKRRTDNS